MEKSKELEALERIANKREVTFGEIVCDNVSLKSDYKKVKNALIRKEKLEKAIEIIKNKLIDVGRLYGCMVAYPFEKTPIHYNEDIDKRYTRYMLTQEEYDLLKEIVGDEN